MINQGKSMESERYFLRKTNGEHKFLTENQSNTNLLGFQKKCFALLEK